MGAISGWQCQAVEEAWSNLRRTEVQLETNSKLAISYTMLGQQVRCSGISFLILVNEKLDISS